MRQDESDVPRVLDRLLYAPDKGRPQGGACTLCGAQTHDRKPYCLIHIDRLPYVKQVLAEIAAGAMADDPDYAADRPMPLTSPPGKAILAALVERGVIDLETAWSVSGLTRKGTASRSLDMLERRGLVSVDFGSPPGSPVETPRRYWTPTPAAIALLKPKAEPAAEPAAAEPEPISSPVSYRVTTDAPVVVPVHPVSSVSVSVGEFDININIHKRTTA